MKKFTGLSWLLLLSTFIGFAKEYSGREANSLVKGAELVRLSEVTKIPQHVKFRNASEAIPFSQFENWIKTHYRVPQGTGFRLINVETDPLGFSHYRYQQTINNMPVEGSMYLLHVKNNTINSMNGLIFDNIIPSTAITFDTQNALNYALGYTNATTYRWQIPFWENQIRITQNNPNATWYPKGELVYAPANGRFQGNEFRLCYKFDIYAEVPFSRNYVFVDALTGQVIYTQNRIHHGNTTGTAITAYSGVRTITTDSVGPTTYRLRETGRGQGVETYNLQQGTNYVNTDFTDSDNNWNNVNPQLDQYATDAHWGAEMTYDYYFVKFNRNSIDNAGLKLLSYVHYDQNYVNAFWDGTQMTYGDGNGTYTPLTSLDVTGHEISHGVTEYTSGLIYSDESGALNEAFSDCMGNAIRYYGKQPATIDWLIGDEIGGTPFRNMADPNQYQNPDCYGGQYWNAPNEVHNNSGVMNFWFYLLTEGGTGTNDLGNAYNVTGIGIDNAAAICYRMNTVYLVPSSDYAEARYYAVQAAIDLFGPCTPEVIATVNAWYACGVGAAFVPGVNSDFTADVTVHCQTPATVQFTNQSNNAGYYTWDFGDGSTSTLINPQHTYSNYGTYDVKLISDGATCGIDSILKIGYVSVDTANPCIISMPINGVAATQTSCIGQLYDDGGPSANYSDNASSSITIAPFGAASVQLNFSLFDLEDTYDFLYIYDGATTNSPLIGSYTGTNSPGTVNSTGGSITIRFTSDVFVTNAGFALTWQCQLPNTAPTPNFSTDVTSSCNGVVNFTDLSLNGPTSWLWDFGDGFTSTQQNPVHTYTTNGNYTVALTSTNGFGSNTITMPNLITINLPSSPSGTGASTCAGMMAVITATGGDSLVWFNAPTGGTALYTGPVFITPPVSVPTTFYVENQIYPAPQNVGPVDNTFGGGSIFTNTNYHDLVFDCYAACKLVSVKVYAQGSGIRTITLKDNAGNTLQSIDINLPSGMSIATLNFDIPAGTDLELGCEGNVDLYRNNSGATFPYDIAGLISIKGTNAGSPGYYYYFYDWTVQGPPCVSARTPVNVTIEPTPVTAFSFNYLTNVVNFIDASTGATSWSWSFGDGGTSTLQNPQHTYATIGTYTVTLTTYAGGTCSSTVTQQIVISVTGIEDFNSNNSFTIYPNPVTSVLIIDITESFRDANSKIEIYNALGELVINKKCNSSELQYIIDANKLIPGVYTVKLSKDTEQHYKKIVKQ